MNKLQQNVPRLRFSEFSGEWEIKKLGDVTGKMQSGLSRKLNNNDIGLPVIRSNNIKNRSIDISNLSYWYIKDPQGADTENYILDNCDLLINFINSPSQIGKFALYKGELDRKTIFTTNIMRLTFIDQVSPIYIALSLDSKRYFDYIQSITKPAVNQASFTTIDLKKYKIYLPNFIEQQKIANFLTAVDDKISILDKKVTALKQYKKGVMQKIFSQQIRFKDKNNNPYPKWEKKKLGDIVDIKTGKKDVNQGNPNGKYPFFTCARNHTYCDGYSFEGEAILIAGNGEVGLCTYYAGKFEAYQRTYVLQKFLIPTKYLYVYLKDQFQEFAESQKQQGSMPYIKLETLLNFPIPIQQDEEQQKIASFLTAIDNKITAEESKLKTAKEWKKGLLQKIFV